ncbi:MAG: hypothetical protein A4E65_01851 [Syntrophorhabdus sp. PtaU1.Bin153]|nr:MAG: hypothetical protein A4E65_01851 [Syntrophorhabdus sp. PtaU1.Bin153]
MVTPDTSVTWSEIVDRGLPLGIVRMTPSFPFLHQGWYSDLDPGEKVCPYERKEDRHGEEHAEVCDEAEVDQVNEGPPEAVNAVSERIEC